MLRIESVACFKKNEYMIRVIINADDLGKSHKVNMAIADALRKHIITSTTILSNSDTWEEIHSIIKENPQASFGLHLNLTEGRALTNSPVLREYNIVDDNNCFTKHAKNITTLPEDLRDAISDEWDAQLKKVIIEEYIPISHIDGHHHIHTRYVYLDILVALLNKYKIKKVRNRYETTYRSTRAHLNRLIESVGGFLFTDELIKRYKTTNPVFGYVFALVENKRWRSVISKTFSFTDYFNSYENQVKLSKKGLTIPQNVTIELMCHPGHPQFEKEYEMIEEFAINTLHSNIQYINYNEL